MQKQKQELHRGLEERHISLMSLGAAIGVGLFLGSASAIQLAGPGILVAYAASGLIMFYYESAWGNGHSKTGRRLSFSRYARDYLGPLAGYLTGWNYWFLWVVTCMAEITAVGIYMGFWFPDVPNWIWALSALVIMTGVNFMAVKAYGELEFWFALIKIVAILSMIAAVY
nr:amino acid permease [Bacillus subtilis]